MLQKLPTKLLLKNYFFKIINIKICFLTLASSAVSDKAGGSLRQKNSRTLVLLIKIGLDKISLTNFWSPRILSSRKLGAKLSPIHFFLGNSKFDIDSFCLFNCDNSLLKSVYLLKTNQHSPVFISTLSL